METGKILEILKIALTLYKKGKVIFTVKDVMNGSKNYYLNNKSTEQYYEECLYYLHIHNFFGKAFKHDLFVGYTFEQAKYNYLK